MGFNYGTNELLLVGKVLSVEEGYVFEDQVFYEVQVEVDRKSDTKDILPVIVPEKLMFRKEIKPGDNITLSGEIRMTNRADNGFKNIYTYGFVKDYEIFDDKYWDVMDVRNYVKIEGTISKEPRHRQTTLTNRLITDLLVANNRPNKKAFYIPCICWGFTAKMASRFCKGDKVMIEGRFQSRRYKKDPLRGKPNDYSIQEISATDVKLIEESKKFPRSNNESKDQATVA